MENVVPGALQRLRAADIFRMAGLTAASLGQEYSHSGAVHSTRRQGARITGIIDISGLNHRSSLSQSTDLGSDLPSPLDQFVVEVEVLSPNSWTYTCTCNSHTSTLCPHAAALLYQWLAQPMSFLNAQSSSPSPLNPPSALPIAHSIPEPAKQVPLSLQKSPPAQRNTVPPGNLTEILAALSLAELRSIAREYDLLTNGLNKQQLVEAVDTVLQQPEIVRRVATTLEKNQRQLVAALTLAGGAVSDEDLRGLFERFSLGPATQLQSILLVLQNKALLFRTTLNSSSQQRIGLSGALLDVGWYVPVEVRAALHVSVPVTSFAVDVPYADEPPPTLAFATPYALLADMLLVARALDGYDTSPFEHWLQFSQSSMAVSHAQEHFPAARTTVPLSSDGSCALPPPLDLPPAPLISLLQTVVPRSPAYLRFVVRLLRLTDMLKKDDLHANCLQALPDLASSLLGPASVGLVRDLFFLWLERSSYAELFELQEENSAPALPLYRSPGPYYPSGRTGL